MRAPIEIVVFRRDLARAQELILEARGLTFDPDRVPPTCADCGYDVRGLGGRTACAECGSDLNMQRRARLLAQPVSPRSGLSDLTWTPTWQLIPLLVLLALVALCLVLLR